MNWVPFLFIDSVCHQLELDSITQVKHLSNDWHRFAIEHDENRRRLNLKCQVNGPDVLYFIQDSRNFVDFPGVLIGDLDSEYDRIASVTCESGIFEGNRVSLDEFQFDLLPLLAPLVANSAWWYLHSDWILNRFFFTAFANCAGFKEIRVIEQGRESLDFLLRQAEFGNVQLLYLSAEDPISSWSEPEKLGKALEKFVNSSRFHQLTSRGPQENDLELMMMFLERALANELQPAAHLFIGNVTFDESQLESVYPQCREYSKLKNYFEWWIPNSSLKVTIHLQRAQLFMQCV